MPLNRIVNLYVGKVKDGNKDGNAYNLSAFDFSFSVTRSIYWFENSARITIYNLSKDSENKVLAEGGAVILEAGYEDTKIGNIFLGQIGYVESNKKDVDKVTDIFCVSGRGGQYQLARIGISVKYKKGTGLNKVFEDIANYCGLAYKGRENIGDIFLDADFVYVGDVAKLLIALRDMVLYKYGAGAYIDNNEIIVYRLYGDASTFNIANLTKKSGLLSVSKIRDEGKNEINYKEDLAYWMGYSDLTEADKKAVEEKLAKQKAEKEELKKRECIKFTSLIRSDIFPNTTCYIKDDDEGIDGRYLITKCNYFGDNFGGDYKVECEAML